MAVANVLNWTGLAGIPFGLIPYWSNPLNWSPQAVPTTGDTLIFPASALDNFPINDIWNLALNVIVFEGGGYNITGHPFTLETRIDATNSPGAANVIANDIYLNPGAGTINVSAGAVLNLAGAIAGQGGITKMGSGELHLSGPTGNSYEGPTTVKGYLYLEKSGGSVGAVSQLTIGDGLGSQESDVVVYNSADENQLGNVTINIGGLLDLNRNTAVVDGITLVGGDIRTETGTLFTAAEMTVSLGGNIWGNLNFYGGQQRIVGLGPNFNLNVHANITDQYGGGLFITTAQSGYFNFFGSNSFTGPLTISHASVYALNPWSLGATNGAVTVTNGAVLNLYETSISDKVLYLEGGNGSLFPGGTLNGVTATWAGPITLIPSRAASLGNGEALLSGGIEIIGKITGSADLCISGGIRFSGSQANDYTGVTKVTSGLLELNKSVAYGAVPHGLRIGGYGSSATVRFLGPNQTSPTSPVQIGDSGLLDINEFSDTIGALTGSAGASINLADGSFAVLPGTVIALHVNNDNASSTFAGLVYGPWSLAKEGSGTLTLNNNNTYTGKTYVNGGTLIVNGSQPQSSISVANGAALTGAGTVGSISASGVVSPGPGPAILTSGNVSLGSSAAFIADLTGPAAGTGGYNQLNVRGSVGLNNAALMVSPAFTSPVRVGQQFVIINNDLNDSVTGTFRGLAEGSTFSVGGMTFSISYAGGDGNDVVVTLAHLPMEPAHPTLSSGNGSGALSPNECSTLSLVLSNSTSQLMSGITATLASADPNVMVTQPRSGYPDTAAFSLSTNATPFQISTLPSFVCGSNAVLNLTVTSAAGTFTTLIILTSGGSASTPMRYDVSGSVGIPDVGTVESTNPVAGFIGSLAKVVVSLDITHSYDQDLTNISLIAPDGTTVLLSSANGSGGQNYGSGCSPDSDRTTFDDAAAIPITSGAAPFIGVFQPHGRLGDFHGTTANGNWRLRIQDGFGGSLGTLRCWSLFLYPVVCAPGGGACALCPGIFTNALSLGTALQTNRLSANGVPSSCSTVKTCPGVAADGFQRHYQAYPFYNGATNSCITVTILPSICSLFSAAYLGTFNPADLCANYLADSGAATTAGTMTSYSFNVPSNSVFVVTICEYGNGFCLPSGLSSQYQLAVSGGDCRPIMSVTQTVPGTVDVSWPTMAGGYSLEATPSLSPATWTQVTDQPLANTNRFHVTNSTVTSRSKFYRLHKP
jgi:autotransporter-associated beta strand protein